MNRIREFFVSAIIGMIAVVVVLSVPAFLSARQDSDLWPDSGTSTVDHAVQHADFESGQIVNKPSSAVTEQLNQEATERFVGEDSGGNWATTIKRNLAGADFTRILSSLAIVLGGYFGFVWLMRRIHPRSSFGLPKEVVEVLGQAPFGPKKQLQLVRLGSKLLLLINSGEGTQTIGEITDPDEVQYLASLCGTKRSGNAAIAIGKAAARSVATQSVKSAPQQTHADLRQILNQLQQVTQQQNANSVFEA